ncbi:hypothetical protein QBC34DRAFT_208 [Podospora aff. communis PSN243]|uniref:Uncharacterized protein n=1 Tax=Podospora aff. communis PSN243 TaxID=3040156 RepID=A0AAV9H5L3_9PEZI|nr:hypothetical protein QBC34DRAFT_208 [Podospora aff. communis PSN243]
MPSLLLPMRQVPSFSNAPACAIDWTPQPKSQTPTTKLDFFRPSVQTFHGDFSVNQDAEPPPPQRKGDQVLYQAHTRHLPCLAEIETLPANSCRLRVYDPHAPTVFSDRGSLPKTRNTHPSPLARPHRRRLLPKSSTTPVPFDRYSVVGPPRLLSDEKQHHVFCDLTLGLPALPKDRQQLHQTPVTITTSPSANRESFLSRNTPRQRNPGFSIDVETDGALFPPTPPHSRSLLRSLLKVSLAHFSPGLASPATQRTTTPSRIRHRPLRGMTDVISRNPC